MKTLLIGLLFSAAPVFANVITSIECVDGAGSVQVKIVGTPSEKYSEDALKVASDSPLGKPGAVVSVFEMVLESFPPQYVYSLSFVDVDNKEMSLDGSDFINEESAEAEVKNMTLGQLGKKGQNLNCTFVKSIEIIERQNQIRETQRQNKLELEKAKQKLNRLASAVENSQKDPAEIATALQELNKKLDQTLELVK